MSTVRVDGVEVAYEVRGSGPQCLALPGGPGFDAGYLHSAELERHFTMIYVDPLGTGASGTLERYSMTKDVAAVEALRIALGIDKLTILGHSYGGFIALRYATEHPEHVKALVLYSTGPATGAEWMEQLRTNLAWFAGEPWFPAGIAAFQQIQSAASPAEAEALFAKMLPFYFVDWTRDQARFAGKTPQAMSFAVNKHRDQEVYDVRARLGMIAAPTLIIAGDKDFGFGVVPSTWSQQGIPGATLVVIERAGHFAHVEQPAAFEQAIAPFAASLR